MNTVRALVSANVLFATMGLGLASPIVQAADQGTQVTWSRIAGIVVPESLVGRPSGGGDCNVGVDCIAGTPAPWTVTWGTAKVNLDEGVLSFTVKGLVLAGDPSFANLGTRGPVRKVKGTLVCNDTEPGIPEFVDSDAVILGVRGNATFSGPVSLPPSCTSEPGDIVFLIRIAQSEASFLVDRWNAFGAVRAVTRSSVN